MPPPKEDKKWEFLTHWHRFAPDMPDPVGAIDGAANEHHFAKDETGENYRFDFCWPVQLVAVEIDGGNHMVKWSRKLRRYVVVGGHTKDKDYYKLNLAASLHWQVFRFTPAMLAENPAACVEVVRRALMEG